MSRNLDLVISELDYNNDEKLASTIEDWYKRDSEQKHERALAWSQSVNFLVGNQWIRYEPQERRWETIPVTDANRHIDRPTSNHINRWVRINVSGYTHKPNISIEPNSNEPSDKTAAALSEIVHRWMWEDMDKDDQYYECALWAAVAGIAIRKSFKKSTSKYIQADKKDEKTRKRIKTVDSCPVSPFNILFDGLPTRFRDVGIIMETTVKRLDTIKSEYSGSEESGYTGEAEKITEEKIVSSVLGLAEGLKSIVEGTGASNQHSDQITVKDSAVVKEVYVKPSSKYPRGRMVVVANNKVLYKGDSPYYYQNGRIWHPYSMCNYWRVPGMLWGMGLCQQLVPFQRRINSIDALIAYNRKTVAVPWVLNPRTSGMDEGEKIGIPGQQIDYDPDATGANPEIVHGMPLPNQILQEREMLLQDADQIAMSGDIRSGSNPKGVNTVGQLKILTEQAEMSRSKQITDWEKFIEQSEKLDLLNFQACYSVPLEEVYSRLSVLSKDIVKDDWDTFIGTHLKDNSTIQVEKGSTLQKSRLAEQALIIDLARDGLLSPQAWPDQHRYKRFMEKMGLSDMFSDADVDETMAEKVIERMLEGKYPPMLEVHNPDIHMIVIARYMKQEKFLELQPDIQRLFFRRYDELAKRIAEYPVETDFEAPQNAIERQNMQKDMAQSPDMGV